MRLEPSVTIPIFQQRKAEGRPIAMVTAYDAGQARLADAAGVDAILVGDSLGNVVLGYETTLAVTLDDVVRHTQAAARGIAARPFEPAATDEEKARGARHALLIADLPFGTYGISPEESVRSAARLIAEGGAQAVKLEGGTAMAETIRRITDIGIPVMGHVGMTPQYVHRFGGFKMQGKTEEAARQIIEDARAVAEAGAFAVVLEVIPPELARQITESIPIPTIGIGAGPDCDGQVQVLHDLAGLLEGPVFKHARRYTEAGRLIREAIRDYAGDVRSGHFLRDDVKP